MRRCHQKSRALRALAMVLWLVSGCRSLRHDPAQAAAYLPPPEVPRELVKVTLPPYTVEPPDILAIDAVRIVPLPPYRANTLDVLMVQVTGTLPDSPISGAYAVQPGGV